MNAGTLLLAVGSLAAVGASAAALARRARLADGLLAASAAALGLALAWLAALFLAGGTDVAYVWAHTSTTYPWAYRLAGVWAGTAGTVVLWAAFLALAAWTARRLDVAGALRDGATAVLAALAGALGLLAISDATFAPTDAALLALRPEGQGLVEVLVTPLMVIHPPIQFAAYALAAVPAAYAVAGLWTGESWVERALAWARPAWLAATAGLGLGALWAYYVLSFGGFWAWDPVETANLLPWLALTAFLHAARSRDGIGAPLLAISALALVLFATLATRSGLWVSVHAFTDPADRFDPDAARRLVAILDAHLPSAWFAGLLAAWLALAAAAFGRALARAAPAHARWTTPHAALLALIAAAALAAPASAYGALFAAGRGGLGGGALAAAVLGAPVVALYLAAPERRREGGLLAWVATAPLLRVAAGVLGLALVVALALHVAGVNGADRGAFDARAPLLGVPLVALVALAYGHPVVGRRAALAAVGAAVALGVALALAFRDVWPLALGAPVLVAAFAAVFARAVQALRGVASRREAAAGALLLASGLLGVVMWANPPHDLGLDPPPALAAVGVAVAAFALVGGAAALDGRALGVARAGALAGALAAGWVVGALLGALAFVLLLRAPRRDGRAAWGPLVRRTGIHVAHLALVLALAGYAAATYASASARLDLAPGETGDVGGVSVAYVATEGAPAGDGTWREVSARLDVDGVAARSAFVWKGEPILHYDPALDVRRGLLRDVYVAPKSFTAAGVGVLREHTAPAFEDWPAFAPENVTRASFEVVVLPGMALVWGGLWGLVVAMALVLVGGAMAEKAGNLRERGGT